MKNVMLPPITDEDVLAYAKYKIHTEHEAKFRDGMRKYKDPIILKDCANEGFQEAWDLINYLSATKLQHSRIIRLVEELELAHPELVNDPYLDQIKLLAGSKPLAVKIKNEDVKYLEPSESRPSVGETRLEWIARTGGVDTDKTEEQL